MDKRLEDKFQNITTEWSNRESLNVLKTILKCSEKITKGLDIQIEEDRCKFLFIINNKIPITISFGVSGELDTNDYICLELKQYRRKVTSEETDSKKLYILCFDGAFNDFFVIKQAIETEEYIKNKDEKIMKFKNFDSVIEKSLNLLLDEYVNFDDYDCKKKFKPINKKQLGL